MGLVEEKVKLATLKTQKADAERKLKQRRKDCADCKGKAGDMQVTSSDGMKCFMSNNFACSVRSNGVLANMIKAIPKLQTQIDKQELIVLAEETKNDVFMKEQQILQQTFTTDKTEQQVAQELAKAKQELAKLQLENAKAESAARLAQKGDLASSRVLLGVQEAEGSWKKPVIISGIIVGAITVGFGIYKLVK
ncbi:MAG: hypothetical protein ACW98D_16720 [Promethearchaeota archaeon]|jgi:multidrug efflux pump subunit AcrA (membrane-fusion protein)